MKTNMNCARGGVAASKKLLAAIAVLAVAFAVFAAIPAVADDSDAGNTGAVSGAATVYVDSTITADDASKNTYKTLTAALEAVADEGTIILKSDLDASEITNSNGVLSIIKAVTIKSVDADKDKAKNIPFGLSTNTSLTLQYVKLSPAVNVTALEVNNASAVIDVENSIVNINGGTTGDKRGDGFKINSAASVKIEGNTFTNVTDGKYVRAMWIDNVSGNVDIIGNEASRLHVFAATSNLSTGDDAVATVKGNTSTEMTGDFTTTTETKDSKFLQVAGTGASKVIVKGNTVSAKAGVAAIPYVNVHDGGATIASLDVDKDLKVTGALTVSGTVKVDGMITVAKLAKSNNTGSITISANATLVADGGLTGDANATINNNGTLINYGTLTMAKDKSYSGNGTFVAAAGSSATFTVASGTTLKSVGAGKVNGAAPKSNQMDLSKNTSVTVAEVNEYLKAGMDVKLPSAGLTIAEKDKIVVVPGSSIDGIVKIGTTTTDSVTFHTVTGDFTISVGNSVDVIGDITGGKIHVEKGDFEIINTKIKSDLTINAASGATVKFSDVTVNSGVTLTLKGAGTFTVVADKSFNLYGSLATADVTAPSTISVIVPEKASFKAYSGSQIAGTILVTGAGNIDLSQAQNPQSVGEDISYDKIYGQLENVTIVDSLTIKNNSTVTVKGGFNVNEGVTLTIEKGSYLIIDSEAASMVVAGKIVVEDGAYLTVTKAKDVQVSGSIESEGTVSINSTVTIKSGGSIVINDNSTTTGTGDKAETVYNSKFSATQGLTVEAGAELIIKSLVVSTKDSSGNAVPTVVTNKGTVTLDGAVLGGVFTVNMAADKAVVQVLNVQSEKDKSGTVTITDAGLKFADKKTIVGTTEGTVANSVTISVGSNVVKGLTVVETVSSKTVDGKTTYYNTLDLAGTVSVASATSTELSTTQAVFSVSGDRIAVTGELTLGKYVEMTVTDKKLSVTGKLVAIEDNSLVDNDGEITVTGLVQVKNKNEIGNINAAMYETKSGTDTIYNYTTLKAAVDAAAKDITVTGTIYVTESFTVPKDTTVKNNGTIVVGSDDDTDVELTFADGAVLKNGTVEVKGTLYFENKKDNKASDIQSDVSVIGEKDARYTNVYTALANAKAGDTVTVTGETVKLTKNITIKEGVTLDVPNSKTLRVFAGVTITVNGTLKVAEKIETGTYDKSETEKGLVQFALAADKLTGKAAIVVSGVFMSGVQFFYASDAENAVVYMIPGAYYHLTDSVGDYYYATTLETASKSAATAVDVYGKVTAGDVAFTGTDSSPKTVTVKAGADLTAASITIDKTTFKVEGRFTGDVKAGESAVTVKNVTGMTVSVVDDVYTVDGAAKYQQLKEGEKASFTVSAGSVYIVEADMAVKVASGATLVSGKDDTTITGTLTIEGTVAVANEQSFYVKNTTGKTDGNVIVKGTLTVAAATDSKAVGIFDVKNYLYIGITSKDITGDAASVTGAVTGVKVAFVKADATVSEATIDSFKVNGVLKSTTYIVEGKDWMTVYDMTGGYSIAKVTEAPVENAEFNYWMNTDGDKVTDEKVGANKCDKVTAFVDYEIYAILVNPAAGIESIAIDGNLMQFGSITDYDSSVQTQMYYIIVKAGTHDITCKLANGYSGDAQFSLVKSEAVTDDGKFDASVSGNKVTVSGDRGVVYVQITGISASGYVQPTEPAQDDKNDGLSLTDILLIILVVLIVVMAIIVALRLMRS